MSKICIALIAMAMSILGFSCSDSNSRMLNDSSYTASPSSPKTQQCPYTMIYVKTLGDLWISNLELIRSIGSLPPDELASQVYKQEAEINKIQREINGNSICIEQDIFLKGVMLRAIQLIKI